MMINEKKTRALLNTFVSHYGEIQLGFGDAALEELTNAIRGSRASREEIAELAALAVRRLWRSRSIVHISAN